MIKKLNELSTKTPEANDVVYIVDENGLTDGKVELQDITVIPETSRTINLNNSMTASDIITEINSIGRYLPEGVVITIKFADGTYTLDQQIVISGFYGGGRVNMHGNTSESASLHTNQAVHLNWTGSGSHGLYVIANTNPDWTFQYLKITTDDGYTGLICQRMRYCFVGYSYFVSTGKTSSETRGVYIINEATAQVTNNYFTGQYYAIEARDEAHIYSTINDDTGTQPNYGIRAINASTIGKNSTQPSGSTANELSQNGGIVR